MTFELHRADARHLPLPDATVDLIVTSPPYFALRSYQDDGAHYDGQLGSEATPAEFLRALWAVLDECWRVLKPSGSCFINLGDKFAGSAPRTNDGFNERWGNAPGKRTQENGRSVGVTKGDVRPKSRMLLPHRFALGAIDPDYRTHVEGRAGDWPQWVCRMDIVWAKPNGLPESVTDRVRASHEYWFHLTRSERYFAAVDEVREEHIGGGVGLTVEQRREDPELAKAMHRNLAARNGGGGAFCTFAGNPLGKLPGSVWSVPSEPLRVPDHLPQHFAAFPSEWPRRLILGWCPPGGTVLDPFVGTGTVCAVAHLLGRHGIGVDLSADYLRLAAWRCTQDWSLYGKATGGEPDTRDPDQLALFEVGA